MSSSLDLAETLQLLGYNVSIGLTGGSILYKLRGCRQCRTMIPFKNIYTVPKVFQRALRKRSVKPFAARWSKKIKLFIQNLLIALAGRKGRFFKLLAAADIIIDAANFSGKGLALVRSHSGAIVVKNHAGSPRAFEDFWLNDEHLLDPADSNRSRYIAYCRFYDALLFQAPDQASACIERDPALKTRCFVLPPTCQETRVLAASQLDSPYQSGRRAVVCVGSIQPRKAQHLAIEAFSMIAPGYQDVDLHFVGAGLDTDYGAGLLRKVEKVSLQDRVFFHGHRQDYLRFMAHAMMVIQTSEEEGVSRILREAMLMKRPVASFAISGTASLLKAEKEALLVKPGDVKALAEAMVSCLDNPSFAEELAGAAHNRYLLNNSWAAYASNLREIIEAMSRLK